MAVNRGLAKKRPPEGELLDDPKWAQVEELAHRGGQRRVGHRPGAKRVAPIRRWVTDAARVAVLAVAHRYGDLSDGLKVVEGLVAAALSKPSRGPVREHDRKRHQLGRLVARVAEHHSRVARPSDIHSLRDVGRLLVDAG